ncbi:NAD(P)/FAD-dependent oxidoreductase [Streptomyces griseochromogenes]|uniref:NAD(P)/FAD-dependent oxidoreductase n=1 Tax=Streptomyces griseochromogenes TaxID=68214 RepID=UPI0037BA5BC3
MSRRAVVIGAGAAGMLAAAALSPVVDHVVVLDRDELPDGPEHRTGVPQGRHAHLLMHGGLEAMEKLLPRAGMREALLAAGARQIPLSSGMLALTPAGWFRRWRHHDAYLTITCSRALLDWVVRTAVLRDANVTVHRAQATGLLGSARKVLGVRLAPVADGAFDPGLLAGHGLRLSGDGREGELDADFVVDASGRGTRIVRWLEALGIHDVREENLDSGLVNATRVHRVPEGARNWPLTLIQADPYSGRPGRSGMIVPIENDQWMVSLGGTRGSEPPKDPDAFLAYALDLPSPLVGRLIAEATPLTPVFTSHSTSNSRRYLEKTRLWPDRFVALGDAAATFNPLYGQGISVAALGAQSLAEAVRQTDVGAPGLARRVQREAARYVEAAWSVAVSTDVLYPGVEGGRPTLAHRLTAGYSKRLTTAATGSYRAASAVWDITCMRTGPTRLMRPDALLSALIGPPLPALSGPPLTADERAFLATLTHAHGRGTPSPAR